MPAHGLVRRRLLLHGSCFFIAPLLSSCSIVEHEVSIHYRITLKIDTPQGLMSGSSVWEARLRDAWLSSPHGTVQWGYSGEAIAVDLPNGTLFALIQSPHDGELPFSILRNRLITEYGEQANWHETWKSAWPRWKREKLHFELPPDDYPMLVRFRDIRNPKTVERVDPDDLAASFGAAISLTGITIEITDDPVNIGISHRFVWWEKYRNLYFDGSQNIARDLTNKNIQSKLSAGSFSTEYNE